MAKILHFKVMITMRNSKVANDLNMSNTFNWNLKVGPQQLKIMRKDSLSCMCTNAYIDKLLYGYYSNIMAYKRIAANANWYNSALTS